jgi:hypothetical protein
MTQEHLFCAEVFHPLHNRIDHSKLNLFCLDGRAAKQDRIVVWAEMNGFYPRETK